MKRSGGTTHRYGRATLALRGGPPGSGGLGRIVLRVALWLVVLLAAGGTVGVVRHVEGTYGAHYSSVPERPARVVVVDLDANRRTRGGDPPGLARWRDAALAEGIELELASVESLASVELERYGAVVLPGQERLAEAELDRVLALLREGVGVIFTGHPGLRDRDGRRRDAVPLESLLPGAVFVRLRRPSHALRVALGGPLTAGFAPGERIELEPPRDALAVRGPGALAWSPEPRALDDVDAALLHGALEEGPLVWLSPSPALLSDAAQAQRLLRNALRYALHEPVLELRPWPGGAPTAALVGADQAALASLAAAGLFPADLPEPEREGADLDRRLARLLTWFAAVEHEGGLYALAADSDWLPDRGRSRLAVALREELRAHNVWLARAPELARWSHERQGLEAELELLGPGHASVVLHNGGPHPVARATVRVYLPPGARPPTEVESESLLSKPLLHVDSQREWVDVIVPSLASGEVSRYSFRY